MMWRIDIHRWFAMVLEIGILDSKWPPQQTNDEYQFATS
jgi:hypothetical protein